DYTKPGPGIAQKKEMENYSYGNMFVQIGRKFSKLMGLNLLYLSMNFPLFFGAIALSGRFNIPYQTPATTGYQTISGLSHYVFDPAAVVMEGLHGHMTTSSYPGTTSTVLYYLTLLVLLTFGVSTAALTLVNRNLAKGEYSELAHDFFGAIKKNFRQAFFVGILDLGLLFVIAYAVMFYYYNFVAGTSIITSFMFFVALFIAFIYIFMRYYIYLMLVTFNLKTFKLFKNAWLFATLGFKRNMAATFFIVFTILLNIVLFVYLMPVGALLPFIITLSLLSFIATYSAYPVIKRL
ncbi:MAG TPA: hypothetical protein DCY75_10360, partial [Clostridiales bacterium]|nr:hypothetical protein [Clostridiales bacterium]